MQLNFFQWLCIAEVSAIAALRIAHWKIWKHCVVALCALRKQSCGIVYCGPEKHAALPTSDNFLTYLCRRSHFPFSIVILDFKRYCFTNWAILIDNKNNFCSYPSIISLQLVEYETAHVGLHNVRTTMPLWTLLNPAERFKLLCGFFLSKFGWFSRNKKCGKCVQGRWKLPQGQTRGQEGRAGWAAEAGQHTSHQIEYFQLGLKRNCVFSISRKYEILQNFVKMHEISQNRIENPIFTKITLLFLFMRRFSQK